MKKTSRWWVFDDDLWPTVRQRREENNRDDGDGWEMSGVGGGAGKHRCYGLFFFHLNVAPAQVRRERAASEVT